MVAGVVVGPTEVVEQRPGPICRRGSTLAEIEAERTRPFNVPVPPESFLQLSQWQ